MLVILKYTYIVYITFNFILFPEKPDEHHLPLKTDDIRLILYLHVYTNVIKTITNNYHPRGRILGMRQRGM
jgi:hypothetical protein